jgi:hypothetical protein
MRLRTFGESQLVNVANLLDTMPAIGVDFHASMNGPFIAFDHGYGKVSFINLLMERNYKVITIANAVGSEHPFVGTTAIDAFKKKVRVTHPHLDIEAIYILLQDNNIPNFMIQDIDNILFGPEVKVARHMNDHLFHAVAIRDVYDKKVAQKILRFFFHGFPEHYFLKYWIFVLKKTEKILLNRLFYIDECALDTKELESILIQYCNPLMHAQ